MLTCPVTLPVTMAVMDWKTFRHEPTARPPRQSHPGEVLWRLHHPNGTIHRCEIRNDRRLSGRRDLHFFENEEFLFSRMCSSDFEARTIAEMAKKDYLRCGASEIDSAP